MKITLLTLVALALPSCALHVTPDGGKEVVIDAVKAFELGKKIWDSKSTRKVQ